VMVETATTKQQQVIKFEKKIPENIKTLTDGHVRFSFFGGTISLVQKSPRENVQSKPTSLESCNLQVNAFGWLQSPKGMALDKKRPASFKGRDVFLKIFDVMLSICSGAAGGTRRPYTFC
jgi:hypothetical protein